MLGTIVWVKAKATGRPNDQRFRVDAIGNGHLLVTSMGNDEVLAISPNALCGIEIDNETTIYFTTKEILKEKSS